jgi:circadian clock protein KaiB
VTPAAVRLTLYIAGEAPNSVGARTHLNAALADFPGHAIEVEIVDVVCDPDRGLRDGVLATPMLIRRAPLPERRILGNLRDRALLLAVLGLAASES